MLSKSTILNQHQIKIQRDLIQPTEPPHNDRVMQQKQTDLAGSSRGFQRQVAREKLKLVPLLGTILGESQNLWALFRH